MSLLFWGLTFGTIGKVMLALAVLHMHHTLVREHRVDKYVILSYKQERILTFLGVVLIVTGYAMEILFYQPTIMLTCDPIDLNRFLTE
jgi:hypothetical protein